jgi:CBS domain containing-hemolysin-like protein
VAVPAGGTIDDFARITSGRPDVSCFLVEGPEGFVGFLTRDSALRPPGQEGGTVKLADLADRRYVIVGADTPLLDVLTRLRAAGASVALVADEPGSAAGGIQGLIAKQQIANAVIDGMELFAD